MATFEGGAVTVDMVPAEVKELFPLKGTSADFTIRLKTGGTMELIDTVLTIGKDPVFGSSSKQFFALDKVTLKNATIVTNGNDLAFFCNQLISNNGRIVAFAEGKTKAANGADGTGASAPGEFFSVIAGPMFLGHSLFTRTSHTTAMMCSLITPPLPVATSSALFSGT